MINKLESEILNQIVIAISVIKIEMKFNRFPSALSSVANVQAGAHLGMAGPLTALEHGPLPYTPFLFFYFINN